MLLILLVMILLAGNDIWQGPPRSPLAQGHVALSIRQAACMQCTLTNMCLSCLQSPFSHLEDSYGSSIHQLTAPCNIGSSSTYLEGPYGSGHTIHPQPNSVTGYPPSSHSLGHEIGSVSTLAAQGCPSQQCQGLSMCPPPANHAANPQTHAQFQTQQQWAPPALGSSIWGPPGPQHEWQNGNDLQSR